MIKLGFKKNCFPDDYARLHIYGPIPLEGLRVKVIRDERSSDKTWVRFYAKRKWIWHCNYPFYKSHFTERQAGK